MKKLPLFILIGLLGLLFLLTLPYGGGFWPRAVASDIAPERLVEFAWPCRGHDPGHTGQSLYQGSQTDALKWNCQTGGQVYSSPAIGAGGTIYIGSYDKGIYALNPEGGGQKWSYKTDGCVYSSPAIGCDGTIYAGSLDDSVYAVNSQDGSKKWSYQTGNRIFSSPAVGPDGTVYIGSLDSYVYALHSDGHLKWKFQTGDRVYSSPAVGADGIVYIGSYDYKVYAIDAQTGRLKWSYQTEDAVNSSPAIGADGTIYVGSLDGNVYALKSQDGTVKWSYKTGGAIYSSPAIARDGVVYIGSLDGYVYALHGQDGSLKWKFETGAEVYSSPAISADDTVYIGSLDGMIYALRCQDAVLKWSFQTGRQGGSGTVGAPVTGIISSPAIGADGTVYIANSDGKIYAFNSAKPGISQGATAMDVQPSQSGTPLPLDLKAPQISCPADMTVSATGVKTIVKFTATAADDVDLKPVIAYSLKPGSEFSLGTAVVKVTATDSSGKFSTCSFPVTVKDSDPPAIICPPQDGITVSATGPKTIVNFKVEAKDNVDSSPNVVYDHEPGSEFSLGTELVKVIATDSSKNSSSCSFLVTVKDDKPPKITCPTASPSDAIIVSATGIKTPVTFTVTAKDNVDPNPEIVCDPPAGSGFPVGTTRVMVTATDLSKNSSVSSFLVTVTDTDPPQITCPALDIISATGRLTRVSYAATATDNVDLRPQITYDHVPNSEFPLGVTIVNVTATDFSGNHSTCYFRVTLRDIDPPRVLCPGTVTATAKGSSKTGVNFYAQAIDNVDTVCQIVYDPPSGSEFPLGTTPVKVTATDSSGNSSYCIFQVVVTKGGNSSPKINSPLLPSGPSGTMTVSATGSKTKVSYAVTATDDDDPHPVISYDHEPGSEFPLGTTSVTATATDSSGNSSTYTFFVTVQDTTPPEIVCTSEMTIPAMSKLTKAIFSATAKDNVDSNPKITYNPAQGSEFPPGTTSVSVTATDSSGNSSVCSFLVTIKDTTPPQILCPSDMTIPPTGRLTRVNFSATAYDNVDSNPQITYNPAQGYEFPLGTTSVTATATDSSGNSSFCSFKVTIKDVPLIKTLCPSDMTISATSKLTKVNFSATAIDNMDSNPQITYDPSPGSEFPLGTTSVTATATDSSGNSSVCSFKVTIKDTTPPQITCPSDMVVPATGLLTKVSFTATAIDNVDPNPIISYDHAPGSEFPVGTTSVTVTATDFSGNSSACSFHVTIRDIPPPQIICPSDITIPATGKLTKVNFSATAYDNVDSNPQITYDHAPGSEFPAGTTSVKVTATDKEGNVSTCTFKVTVQDTTLPVVTLSLGEQASYDAIYDGVGAPDEQAPYYTSQSVSLYYTVYDNCDSDPQVKVELSNNNDKPVDIKSSSPIAVDLAQYAGKNVVTLTAIDAFGNIGKASVSFEVALKLAEDQVSIKPETLRLRPNTFTVSLSFPPPYDATTVYDVNADGAKHKTIVYNPTTRKAICDFKRSDINIVPLDQRFEVTGFFMYKDTACKFYGSDTIRKVRWPTKNSQPLVSGQSVRSGETTSDCQWPFCNRLESLLNH